MPEVYKEVGTQSHGNPCITSVQMLQFVAGRCACHPHKLQELTSTRHSHNDNESQGWSSAETYTTLEILCPGTAVACSTDWSSEQGIRLYVFIFIILNGVA